MRSDATFVSVEFQTTARNWLEQNNPNCLPAGEVKQRQTKHRNTQEGHEAVRPTQVERVPKGNTDVDRLYDLIWRRAVASQCSAATIENTKIAIVAGEVTFEATGKQVRDRGYAQYWNDLGDDRSLPEVKEGQILNPTAVDLTERQTKPPSPYSEPELVNLLERRGIGRPSTFSSTIETLLSRRYVRRQKKKLVPTDLGREVDRFLSETVPDVIDADFTSELEESLDKIAEGQLEWQQFLIRWNREFFQPAIDKARQTLTDRFGVEEDETCRDICCQKCGRQGMDKIYSASKKIEGGHLLKERSDFTIAPSISLKGLNLSSTNLATTDLLSLRLTAISSKLASASPIPFARITKKPTDKRVKVCPLSRWFAKCRVVPFLSKP